MEIDWKEKHNLEEFQPKIIFLTDIGLLRVDEHFAVQSMH